jgi:hypothetical protein
LEPPPPDVDEGDEEVDEDGGLDEDESLDAAAGELSFAPDPFDAAVGEPSDAAALFRLSVR